jgi:hypothetical protein
MHEQSWICHHIGINHNEKIFLFSGKENYQQWIEDFLVCCKSGLIYRDVLSDNTSFIDDQTEFMKSYPGRMLLYWIISWNQERIKRFLSIQTRIGDLDTIELYFVGRTPYP